MNFKILINSKGSPRLVEVPEKPTVNSPYNWQQYNEALTSALNDEEKHIEIKNGHGCFNLKHENGDYVIQGINDFKHHIGESFDLPTGVSVSFEEEKMCESHCGDCEFYDWDACHENGRRRKLAILTQEPSKDTGLKKKVVDYINEKHGNEASVPNSAQGGKENHFLLGKKIRYRYVDWEEGAFTPWTPCTEIELNTILNDRSIEIVQFKP